MDSGNGPEERDAGPVTQVLERIREGDDRARADLFELVQRELRVLAGAHMRRERIGSTLQPTALVNELYLRLFGTGGAEWNDHAHFLRVAARVMRSILVDAARARLAQRRGGDRVRITFDEEAHGTDPGAVDVVALHEVLGVLADKHPRRAQIVELRFFGGLSVEETARALGVTERTVYREWQVARVWLFSELEA